MPGPFYTITFDKVAPGVALNQTEADSLRKKISTLLEGTPGWERLKKETIFEEKQFTDGRGNRMSVKFKVTKVVNDRNLSVELVSMQKRG